MGSGNRIPLAGEDEEATGEDLPQWPSLRY